MCASGRKAGRTPAIGHTSSFRVRLNRDFKQSRLAVSVEVKGSGIGVVATSGVARNFIRMGLGILDGQQGGSRSLAVYIYTTSSFSHVNLAPK